MLASGRITVSGHPREGAAPDPAAAGSRTAPRHRRGKWRSIIVELAVVCFRAGRALAAHEGFELSGYAAFTAILAIFPFMVFLATLAGAFGEAHNADVVVEEAMKFIPPEVVSVLAPVARDVVSRQSPNLMTLSIIFALWSASSGVEALRTLLNRSYGLVETRPIWKLRPQSLLIVIVGAVLALSLSVTLVLGSVLLAFVRHLGIVGTVSTSLWTLARYGGAGLIVTATVGVLHMTLPNRPQSLGQIIPGALLTAVLWLLGAALFSLYVENFASYSVVYGSLGGIILTLLFFYLAAVVFTFGAEVNAALHAQNARTCGTNRDDGRSMIGIR
jgi:membrane protein